MSTAAHTEIALAELRSQIGDTINRAAYAGERLVVTRNGKPAAALISADDLDYFERLEDLADAAALDAARRDDDGYRINYADLKAKHNLTEGNKQ